MVDAFAIVADRVDVAKFREGAQQLASGNSRTVVAGTGQQVAEWIRHLLREEIDNVRVSRQAGGQVLPRERIHKGNCGRVRVYDVVAFVADVGGLDQPVSW